jgi:hypothetical protein
MTVLTEYNLGIVMSIMYMTTKIACNRRILF